MEFGYNKFNKLEYFIRKYGSTAKTDTVTIAKNTWTHFKTTVDKTNKKVTLEITDASGKTLKKIDIAMSSISDVKGLWYLSGRANGVAGFDNVRIYEESASQKYSVCYSPNHVAAGTTIETQEFTVNESAEAQKKNLLATDMNLSDGLKLLMEQLTMRMSRV